MRFNHLLSCILLLPLLSCQQWAPTANPSSGSIHVQIVHPASQWQLGKSSELVSDIQVFLFHGSEQVYNRVHSSDHGYFRVTINDIEPDTAYAMLIKGWDGDPIPRARAEKHDITVTAGEETKISLTWTAFFPELLFPVQSIDLSAMEGAPKFLWEEVAGAEYYLLEVATHRDFPDSTLVIQHDSLQVTYYEAHELEPGFTYYWRVGCRDSENVIGEWSRKAGFRYHE